MQGNRIIFSWRVARLLFMAGVVAIFFPFARLVVGVANPHPWVLVLVGIALVALSTRGPWDGELSGRNRSILGFHARPVLKQPTSKP